MLLEILAGYIAGTVASGVSNLKQEDSDSFTNQCISSFAVSSISSHIVLTKNDKKEQPSRDFSPREFSREIR